MHTQIKRRYRRLETLRQRGERLVALASDTLTGRRVVLKSDRAAYIQRELQTLLALPPGVGPELHDLVWTPEKRLVLVLEHLDGRTLAEAAPQLGAPQLPALVGGLCQKLAQLHRAGFVYADLTPSNVLLLDGSAPGVTPEVRLIDFDATLTRASDPREDEVVGGTPPFMAPEIARGWTADGRADQFSLGMLLRELFPALADDPAWSPLIERLCQRTAANRFADITAFRRALDEAFGGNCGGPEPPLFGAGPLRGRRDEREQLAELFSSALVASTASSAGEKGLVMKS